MTRIDELLNALCTVIVRYHDKQSGVTKCVQTTDPNEVIRNSRSHAKNLLEQNNYQDQINGLIKNATKTQTHRTKFFEYLLNEIVFLKSLLKHQGPLTNAQFFQLQDHLLELINELKQLLKNTKSTECDVTLRSQNLTTEPPVNTLCKLSGLKNDNYVGGGTYCTSGEFIISEVFHRLGIELETSTEEDTSKIKAMCREFHSHKSVVFLEKEVLRLQSLQTGVASGNQSTRRNLGKFFPADSKAPSGKAVAASILIRPSHVGINRPAPSEKLTDEWQTVDDPSATTSTPQ